MNPRQECIEMIEGLDALKLKIKHKGVFPGRTEVCCEIVRLSLELIEIEHAMIGMRNRDPVEVCDIWVRSSGAVYESSLKSLGMIVNERPAQPRPYPPGAKSITFEYSESGELKRTIREELDDDEITPVDKWNSFGLGPPPSHPNFGCHFEPKIEPKDEDE